MDLCKIGMKFGWAVEEIVGVKPKAFTWIRQCNAITGISEFKGMHRQKIDMTCLEDKTRQYNTISRMDDTSKKCILTFEPSMEFVNSWNNLLDAALEAKAAGKATWMDIYIPGYGSYFVKFEPGEIPMPDLELGYQQDVRISNDITEIIGMGDAIEPTID